ncbi:MAG TPA: D-alanyl-D-alanine carboxypeptidase family protein [Actinomycetota bacterium]
MRHRVRLAAVATALAAALAAGLAPGPAFAATATAAAAGPSVAGRSAILVDAASGAILWSRDPATPRAPASLTKMLTALLVRATLPLDAVAVAGKDAATAAPTRLGLRAGQKLRVGPALEAMMILSANDVAVLLADRAGGSPQRFQAAMNAEAALLGLRSSAWHSPNGLDNPGHQASAYDLAILGRAVLRDPWLARVVRMRQTTITGPDGHPRGLHTHSGFLVSYPGAIGIKTGFTNGAGHCLAAAATRHGRTLIAVVLDSPSPPADAAQLMNWGFAGGSSGSSGGSSRRVSAATAAVAILPPYVQPVGVNSLVPPATVPAASLVTPAVPRGPGGGCPGTAARPLRRRGRGSVRPAAGRRCRVAHQPAAPAAALPLQRRAWRHHDQLQPLSRFRRW